MDYSKLKKQYPFFIGDTVFLVGIYLRTNTFFMQSKEIPSRTEKFIVFSPKTMKALPLFHPYGS